MCYNGAGASSTPVFSQATVGANSTRGIVVSCPSGRQVTGGGFNASNGATVYNTSIFGNGWQARVTNPSSTSKNFIVFATCVDFP